MHQGCYRFSVKHVGDNICGEGARKASAAGTRRAAAAQRPYLATPLVLCVAGLTFIPSSLARLRRFASLAVHKMQRVKNRTTKARAYFGQTSFGGGGGRVSGIT